MPASISGPGEDTVDATTDAYVFGYPLVLMNLTRLAQTNTVKATDDVLAPVNQFCHHTELPDPSEKAVVRPNLDTLYSVAWLDLTAEPMVLSVPVMENQPDNSRYWLMQLMDYWTNTVQDPSSILPGTDPRTDGNGDQNYTYVLTGPGWQGTVPDGTTQLTFPTNTVWLAGRTEIRDNSQEELDTVNGYQHRMSLLPLSVWPDPDHTYVPPDGTYDPNLSADPPSDQIAEMDGTTFFTTLKTLLATTPLNPDDPDMTDLLDSIGLLPGSTQRLPDAATLQQAVEAGQQRITSHGGAQTVNGWSLATTGVGTYGTDYDQRAYIALTALGANLPQDAIYPSTAPQDPAPGTRYTLTFAQGQTPPVGAFWSLTAYDNDGFLITNDEGVYSIGHRTPTPVPDPVTGDTTLYIQYEPPGDTVDPANWLPIDNTGDFNLMLRLYAPQIDQIDPPGTWTPPILTKVADTPIA
ncbi:DUF1254 domain-containing protein [Streptomyces sp. NPDC094448]|uniref:DUF1254 domain-containing protein n=1 Tax=Streptomyces sp. NPDC094448 TaxID=3366063 RepID=UPI0038190E0D